MRRKMIELIFGSVLAALLLTVVVWQKTAMKSAMDELSEYHDKEG